MKIQRLSNQAFEQIVAGRTRQPTLCVIKIYSNKCRLCHALKETYQSIAASFEGVHFFAFNSDDHPHVEEVVGINGVPSILFVKTGNRPRISILEDPLKEKAHPDMWFHADDIVDFVKENIS